MTMLDVFDLISARGSVLVWAIVKGVLIWGSIGLVLAVILYLVATRRGWLDIRGQPRVVARVCYGVVLFVGFATLVGLSGVVHEMGEGTVRMVRADVRSSDGVEQVGGLLVAPVVVARLMVESRDPTVLPDVTWETLHESDMSFLLDGPARERTIEALTDDLVRTVLEEIPGYAAARKEVVRGFLISMAERRVLERVNQTTAPYTHLFRDLRADDHGRLTFAMASETVATTLYMDTVEPTLRAPYQALRWQLIGFAVLALVLGVALIRGVGHLLTRPAAPAEEAPG